MILAVVQHAQMQKLTVEEDALLQQWVVQRAAWGWPSEVRLLLSMANCLLQQKGGGEVGQLWIQAFMRWHPDLRSTYSKPLDKERATAVRNGR